MLVTSRKYTTTWIKSDLPKLQSVKPKIKDAIVKKFYIVPGILLQGVAVVKCSPKDPSNAVITTEIHIEEPESSFDWNLLCALLATEIWRLLFAIAVGIMSFF